MATGLPDGVTADMDAAVETARLEHSGRLLGYATSHRGLRRAMSWRNRRKSVPLIWSLMSAA